MFAVQVNDHFNIVLHFVCHIVSFKKANTANKDIYEDS
jgi:hypothetical protein